MQEWLAMSATPSVHAAMLERLPDPVLLVEGDAAGEARAVFANAAARTLLRIQTIPAPLVNLIRHPELLAAVDDALADGRDREVAYEILGAQTRYWRGLIRPMGEAPGVVLTLHDETDAKRTERMRADFLANASHELRTPLASLAGFIETLQGHARDDPKARDAFLGIMAGQAERMTRLIADLLSLSRIEMNEHIAPEGRVDLAAVLREILHASAPVWAARMVTVDLDIVAGPALVAGDRDQLIQVLQNLIENAVKYSPAGGAVRVSVERAPTLDAALAPGRAGAAQLSLLTPDRPDEQGYVLVRVADDGPGIARQHLPRLSERFYRVEAQQGPERTGTGLGLAIVKHIVNRHRGGFTVESAPGVGTTFSVYLPAAR
jgi:two-component system phosphate regulon sensor histidine kinase PhoR